MQPIQFLLFLSDMVFITVFWVSVWILHAHVIHALFPLCQIWLGSMLLGNCKIWSLLVGMSFAMPLPVVSLSPNYSCLHSSVKWSTSLLSLSVVLTCSYSTSFLYVVFCCDWGGLYMSPGYSNYTSHLGHSYLLVPSIVVIRSISYYCFKHLGSCIFVLQCHCWS